jgi:integrase
VEACKSRHKWEYAIEFKSAPGAPERRRIKKGGFRTGIEAAEARAEILSLERKGLQPLNRKLTTTEWLREWLSTQRDVLGLGEGTFIDYERHVESYWIPAIGKVKLVDLRPSHVNDTLKEIARRRDAEREEATRLNDVARAEAAEADKIRIAKGLKRPIKPKLVLVPRPFGPSTALRVLGTLRSALSSAERAELVTRNVARQAEKPKGRRRKVRPWEPEELGLWLDSLEGQRLYSLYHTGSFAGMRRGELAGLGWDEVDLIECSIVVRWQITNVSYRKARKAIADGIEPVYRTKPKTLDGEERLIYFDDVTAEVLRRRKREQEEDAARLGDAYHNPDNLVFTKENGEPWDPHYLWWFFVESVKRVGLRMVPLHMLRHIAASLLILAGIDIAIISKILGHSKIDLTVQTYGHLIGRVGKRAARKAAKQVPRGQAALKAVEEEGQEEGPEEGPSVRPDFMIPTISPPNRVLSNTIIDGRDRLRARDLR